MLSTDKLLSLSDFQDELTDTYVSQAIDDLFVKRALKLLEKYFGYEHMFTSYLDQSEERTYLPYVVSNGLSSVCVQTILQGLWDHSTFTSAAQDVVALSAQSDYKKSWLYERALQPYGFSDLLSVFYRHPKKNLYTGYGIILRKDGTFTDEDIQIAGRLARTLAIDMDVRMNMLFLQGQVNMLKSTLENLPVGIMLVEYFGKILYTNNLAKKYLGDLGYSDERFFGSFYTNELFPYLQRGIVNYGSTVVMKLKKYRISINSIANFGTTLDMIDPLRRQAQSPSLPFKPSANSGDRALFVSILPDEQSQSVISEEVLDGFNLTLREREVLELVIEGRRNKEIADILSISTNTVKIHISSIFRKLGVRNRVECVEALHQAMSDGAS